MALKAQIRCLILRKLKPKGVGMPSKELSRDGSVHINVYMSDLTN